MRGGRSASSDNAREAPGESFVLEDLSLSFEGIWEEWESRDEAVASTSFMPPPISPLPKLGGKMGGLSLPRKPRLGGEPVEAYLPTVGRL